LNFQSKIIKGAEQDAWVSMALVGISFHLIIWLLYFLFKSRMSLWISIIIVHFMVINVKSKMDVEEMGTFMTFVTSSFLYIYIPILFIFFLILQAFKKAKSVKVN
jgi:hypothetical protein